GDRETRRQILIYSLILAPLGVLPAAIGLAGWIFGAAAAVLGGLFVLCAVRVRRETGDRAARTLFRFSILYLFLLFAMLLIDGAVGRGL
ncbi:MAG: protoheme IX farnesyltransferase, partial [Alphaproteobacteria bacterium]